MSDADGAAVAVDARAGEAAAETVPVEAFTAKPETPQAILAALAETLKTSEGIDTDLAGIVIDHILTTNPHADAVTNAKTAIMKLAAKRAAPPESDTVDG
ncbi:hypothetical protein [Mesorhizobium sp. A623]